MPHYTVEFTSAGVDQRYIEAANQEQALQKAIWENGGLGSLVAPCTGNSSYEGWSHIKISIGPRTCESDLCSEPLGEDGRVGDDIAVRPIL